MKVSELINKLNEFHGSTDVEIKVGDLVYDDIIVEFITFDENNNPRVGLSLVLKVKDYEYEEA